MIPKTTPPTPAEVFEPLPDEVLSAPLLVHLCFRAWEPSLKWAAAVDGTYLWVYAELREEAVRMAIVAYLGCDDDDEMAAIARQAAKVRQFEVRKGTGLRPR